MHPKTHGAGPVTVPKILYSKKSWHVNLPGVFRVQDSWYCPCPNPMGDWVQSLCNTNSPALETILAVLHVVDVRTLKIWTFAVYLRERQVHVIYYLAALFREIPLHKQETLIICQSWRLSIASPGQPLIVALYCYSQKLSKHLDPHNSIYLRGSGFPVNVRKRKK